MRHPVRLASSATPWFWVWRFNRLHNPAPLVWRTHTSKGQKTEVSAGGHRIHRFSWDTFLQQKRGTECHQYCGKPPCSCYYWSHLPAMLGLCQPHLILWFLWLWPEQKHLNNLCFLCISLYFILQHSYSLPLGFTAWLPLRVGPEVLFLLLSFSLFLLLLLFLLLSCSIHVKIQFLLFFLLNVSAWES